jgi:proton glutamate symport protein
MIKSTGITVSCQASPSQALAISDQKVIMTPPAPIETPNNSVRNVTLLGLVVYAIGVALAHQHPLGAIVRALALVPLAYASIERRSITAWTFFAILAGTELGVDAPGIATHLHVLAEIFLRLVRVIVAPLILATLSTGIAAHGRLGSLGRIAWKTFLYFEVVTTFALALGAVAIHISRAGVGITLPASLAASDTASTLVTHPGLEAFLLNMFPENIALAVAQNQILQVAVFAILFGIALAMLPESKKAPMLSLLTSLTDTMFGFTRIIMYFAPIAAGAAMSYAVGSMGLSTLVPLAKLVATFYAAAAAFLVLVLLPVILISRIPLRRFLAAVGEPTALGFATSASEAALPLAMENMEEFGVARWIVSLVIPSGYSFNMTGSSLYLSIAAIFAAQASGIHLTLGAEAVMVTTLMVTSKGIAGVPRAVLAILLATAASFHLATSAVMMILGVDALIDMGRTGLNVAGNCLASAVIGRWEGSTAIGEPRTPEPHEESAPHASTMAQ